MNKPKLPVRIACLRGEAEGTFQAQLGAEKAQTV
jgi:hypothetical protein